MSRLLFQKSSSTTDRIRYDNQCYHLTSTSTAPLVSAQGSCRRFLMVRGKERIEDEKRAKEQESGHEPELNSSNPLPSSPPYRSTWWTSHMGAILRLAMGHVVLFTRVVLRMTFSHSLKTGDVGSLVGS